MAAAYDEECRLTGAEKRNCEYIHIFKRACGEKAFKKQFSHLEPTDLDTSKNVVFLSVLFNNPIEHAEMAFEPVRGKNKY